MKELTRKENAPFALIYSECGVGKTTSIIRTAPQPTYYISCEADAYKSIDVCEAEGEKIDIKVVMPESQEDLMDGLNKILSSLRSNNNKFKYKTLVFDSLTYWMCAKLIVRVEDDRNKDRKGADFGKLSAMSKSDWVEIGTVNSQMNRLTDILKSIAAAGVMVVCTAQLQEDPKWNADLEAAPAFKYKDYNKSLKGYFDYIGYCFSSVKPSAEGEPNKVVYPPMLSFSGSQGYLVKWRGVQPKYLITKFNLRKIFSWFGGNGDNKPDPGKGAEVVEEKVDELPY